jgi:hypothetical protein
MLMEGTLSKKQRKTHRVVGMLCPLWEDSELFQRVVCQIGGRRINAVSTKLHRLINEFDHSDPLKNNTLRWREKKAENGPFPLPLRRRAPPERPHPAGPLRDRV